MAKSLSRFFIRKQDEKNEIATLFFRVQNKKHKVDTLFSSQIRVNVAEWREALSCPEKWMRHQRANFNLHDSLNRIELVVKSEVEGMSFDKSHVEEMCIRDRLKSAWSGMPGFRNRKVNFGR